MISGHTGRTYQQLFKCARAIHLRAACSKNQSRNRSEISRSSSFKRFWGGCTCIADHSPACPDQHFLDCIHQLCQYQPIQFGYVNKCTQRYKSCILVIFVRRKCVVYSEDDTTNYPEQLSCRHANLGIFLLFKTFPKYLVSHMFS